ncbi:MULTISPECIES: trimeric intracellular cation channel family protein [unclassified Luteococcus]|uniref:trimeric intracellular cation channel family protein n=1 Tax=unclassified Luteococcus TaxID=2639923 RepID=UPI00313E4041
MYPLDVPLDTDTLNHAVRFIDLTGVLFNAILGGVMARAENMDPIGFGTLAICSALGGGLIRDTLMQRGTPVALVDGTYFTAALIGAAIAFMIPITHQFWDRLFPVIDALALGAWAAAGSQRALAHGFSPMSAILLGTVTAVGGGMLRDILLRRIPTVFGGNTLYATSAMAGSLVTVLLWPTGNHVAATLTSFAVGSGLTLGGIWRGWTLPMAFNLRPRSTFSNIPRPSWWRGVQPPGRLPRPRQKRRRD